MFDWLDLTQHGLNLRLVKTSIGVYKLCVISSDGSSVRHLAERMWPLGFKAHNKNEKLLFKDVIVDEADGSLKPPILLSEWKSVFPNVYPDVYDPNRHLMMVGREGQQNSSGVDTKKSEVAGKHIEIKRLRKNCQNHDVFEAEGKRFYSTGREEIYETPEANPGLFLRSVDRRSEQACAEALVPDILEGRFLIEKDISSFLEMIGQKNKSQFISSLLVVFSQYLMRRMGKTASDGYNMAHRIQESLISSGVVFGRDDVSFPLQVLSQRLSPHSSDGKTLVSGFSSAAIVAHAPRVANIDFIGSGSQTVVEAARGVKSCDMHVISQLNESYSSVLAHVVDSRDMDKLVGSITDNGHGVLIIEFPEKEEDRLDLEDKLTEFSKERFIEGECLFEQGSSSRKQLIVVFGAKKTNDLDREMRLPRKDITDLASLWTWSSTIVSNRVSVRRKSEVEKVDFHGVKTLDSDENTYQIPYESASRLGVPKTMLPKNFQGSLITAFSNLKTEHFDIDDYVATSYGYTIKELEKSFSPEQIDALALAEFAKERDRAFLLADQTGIGKGRTQAAIIRREAKDKKKVIYFTEKTQNMSDIYRDILATDPSGSVKAMVLNDGVSLYDGNNNVLLKSPSKEELKDMFHNGSWPDGIDVVISTYSQFNRVNDAIAVPNGKSKKSPRTAWLQAVVDEDTVIVADECHNATSDSSNIGQNIKNAVDAAGRVVFSSATFAKTPEAMATYSRLLPKGFSSDELVSIVAKGGDTFQEVLSDMLVRDGVMIRREFDLSKLVYRTVVDAPRFERNREVVDKLSPVLLEMMDLQRTVDAVINKLNRDNGRLAEGRFVRNGFGSPLYTISRLLVASMNIDAAYDVALESLKNDKKPIIVVDNTIQSLLEEVAEDIESLDGVVMPDFKNVLGRIVVRMAKSQRPEADGTKVFVDLSAHYPAIKTQLDKVREKIAELPDIPASAIDEIKRRLKKDGYEVGEITGRTIEISDGRIVARSAKSNVNVKNDFNSGAIDALIINSAGATGIDLHAGSLFKDQRQRTLIELQPPADIVKKIQGRGRVSRYDDVVPAEIVSILCGLPIEMRLHAMENAKIRKMSALTTSNRDTSMLIRGIPDMINPIGDAVCRKYAESRPELMRKLGLTTQDVVSSVETNQNYEEAVFGALKSQIINTRRGEELSLGGKIPKARLSDSKRTANEIMNRLIMLPIEQQERICTEMIAEFNAEVEELEAKGLSPLRTDHVSGKIHEREKVVFDIGDETLTDSAFNDPIYIVDGVLERTGDPIMWSDLEEMISIGEMASGRASGCITRLREGWEDILSPYVPVGITVEEAIAENNVKVITEKKKLDSLISALDLLKPGVEMFFEMDGDVSSAIVTKIEYPSRGYEHVAGAYFVSFVAPGEEDVHTMRLSTIINNPKFSVKDGLTGDDYDRIIKKFDDAKVSKLSKVKILTGNLYRAMRFNVEHNLGKMSTYVNEKGIINRGIVVSKRLHSLRNIPYKIATPAITRVALNKEKIEISTSATLEDNSLRIKPAKGHGTDYEIIFPSRTKRFDIFFENKFISDLFDKAERVSGYMKCRVSESDTFALIDVCYEIGQPFHTSYMNRTLIDELIKKHFPAEEAATNLKPR